jgi:hypothetical protein
VPTVIPEEPEIIERHHADTGMVVRAMSQGEMEMQIELAKKYPREIKRFRAEATALATLDEETASQCFYVLPARKTSGGDSGPIEGPSARFAEIVTSCWGNCHAGARIISEDEGFVNSQGVFRDLERNVTITFECRRRIRNREGRRYSDDMISVTANAACSIALRNAVFKGVPKAFWWPIYQSARDAAVGKTRTLADLRAEWVGYMAKMRVDEPRIAAALGKRSLDEATRDDYVTLRGIVNTVKEGEIAVEEAFPKIRTEDEKSKSGPDQLAQKLAAGKKNKTKPAQHLTKPEEPAKAVAQVTEPVETEAEVPPWVVDPTTGQETDLPAVTVSAIPVVDLEVAPIGFVEFKALSTSLKPGGIVRTEAKIKMAPVSRGLRTIMELYTGATVHKFVVTCDTDVWMQPGVMVMATVILSSKNDLTITALEPAVPVES